MNDFLLRYKYLPFTEGSLKILEDSTLKFTHPDDFNDPFDCLPFVDKEKLAEFMLKEPELNKHFREKYETGANYLKNKQKILKEIERNGNNFLSAALKNVGVLCLSKNPKNILMWSHYAKSHTGFVIEFKINLTINININTFDMNELIRMLYPFPVKYSNERPSLDFGDINASLQSGLLTKHSGWDYEEEERVIDLVNGPGIHQFNPSLINEVILGMKISPDNKNIVLAKVNEFNIKHNTNVKVSSMKPVENEFKLTT